MEFFHPEVTTGPLPRPICEIPVFIFPSLCVRSKSPLPLLPLIDEIDLRYNSELN